MIAPISLHLVTHLCLPSFQHCAVRPALSVCRPVCALILQPCGNQTKRPCQFYYDTTVPYVAQSVLDALQLALLPGNPDKTSTR